MYNAKGTSLVILSSLSRPSFFQLSDYVVSTSLEVSTKIIVGDL